MGFFENKEEENILIAGIFIKIMLINVSSKELEEKFNLLLQDKRKTNLIRILLELKEELDARITKIANFEEQLHKAHTDRIYKDVILFEEFVGEILLLMEARDEFKELAESAASSLLKSDLKFPHDSIY